MITLKITCSRTVFQKIKFKDFHPQIQGLSRPEKSEKKFKEFQGLSRTGKSPGFSPLDLYYRG